MEKGEPGVLSYSLAVDLAVKQMEEIFQTFVGYVAEV